MKKIFLYLFSILFIIFLSPQVYALENYDTYYEFNDDNVYYEQDIMFGNTSLQEFYNDFLSYYSTHNIYYDLVITKNYFRLIPKNTITEIDVLPHGYILPSNENAFVHQSQFVNNLTTHSGSFPSNGSIYDILTSEWYTYVKSCLNGDTCNYSYSSHDFIFNTLSYFQTSPFYGISTTDLPSNLFTNDNSYFLNNTYVYYYSSIPVKFRSVPSNASTIENEFYKTIRYNNLSFKPGDYLPSYLDIKAYTEFDEFGEVGNIYIGNVSKNDLSSLSYNSNFNFEDDLFIDSLSPQILYFGRKNNSTYYSYESISCQSNYSVSKDLSTSKATIIFDSFSCSSDLTNYDNIYMRIYFNYDKRFDNTIINYKGNVNYGYTRRLKDSTANFLNSYIYEHLENLSSSFSIVLSTDYSLINSYFISNNDSIVSVSIDRNTNDLNDLVQNPISYGTQINNNIMIYDTLYNYVNFTNLDLFLDYRTTISISDNDTYTYYDSTNTLTTDTIINNHTLVDINDYDINYYNNVVSDYINSLTADIKSFSKFTQGAYDIAPSSLQLFIHVTFILICIFFTYKLINRR